MNGYFKRKVKGAAGFESVMMFPVMFMAVMLLLYMFLVGISFVQFNNLANVISQDLNMRQSGYSDSATSDPRLEFADSKGKFVETSGDGSTMDGLRQMINGSTMSKKVTMQVTGNSSAVQRSASYSVKKHEKRFYMPGVSVSNVHVEASRNGFPAVNFENVSMSGTIIKTIITFKVYGIEYRGVGYNIIS